MNKASKAVAGIGILIAGVAVAMVPMPQSPDYTTLPPAPAAIEAKLRPHKGALAKAIAVAENAVDGVASSASIDLEATPPVVEVLAYGHGTVQLVLVDARSGIVSSMTAVPRFPGAPVAGDWVETDSGLRYFDIEVGTGPQPADSTASVRVHYTGWLVTGKKFDSSVDRGVPATFPLNGVISGWTEGVGSMRVGGKRKLIIPYALAYGENGRSGIPPRATLIFDIELLGIN